MEDFEQKMQQWRKEDHERKQKINELRKKEREIDEKILKSLSELAQSIREYKEVSESSVAPQVLEEKLEQKLVLENFSLQSSDEASSVAIPAFLKGASAGINFVLAPGNKFVLTAIFIEAIVQLNEQISEANPLLVLQPELKTKPGIQAAPKSHENPMYDMGTSSIMQPSSLIGRNQFVWQANFTAFIHSWGQECSKGGSIVTTMRIRV